MSKAFPLLFRIVATIGAPEGASEDDVKRVINAKILVLKIETVELIQESEKEKM